MPSRLKALGLTAWILLLSSCSSEHRASNGIVGLPNEILLPYLWSRPYAELSDAQALDYSKMDGLNLGQTALNLLVDYQRSRYKAEYLIEARRCLDYLARECPLRHETDFSIVWQYPYAHGALQAGWWSCMDQAVNALAFHAAYQVTGSQFYRRVAEKAITGLISNIQQGGTLLKLGENEAWLSEYAGPEIDQATELYVLNGFSFALLALDILSKEMLESSDTKISISIIKDAFKKCRDGFVSKRSLYYSTNENWHYYMLNPKTIESAHYAIFDLMLFCSLYNATGDPVFKEEIEHRRALLARHYPVEYDASGQYLFSLLGAPYPYWIDVYGIKVSFYREGKLLGSHSQTQALNRAVPLLTRGFLRGQIPPGADRVRVESICQNRRFLLYETAIDLEHAVSTLTWADTPLPVVAKAFFDMIQLSPRQFRLDPSIVTMPSDPESYYNNQGRIEFDLASPICRDEWRYLALQIRPSIDVTSMRIVLTDVNGAEASQYYKPLRGGVDNLIVCAWSGFTDISTLDREVKNVTLTFYTSSTDPVCELEVKEFLILRDNTALYNCINRVGGYFPEEL